MEEECEVCHGTDPRCERTKPMTNLEWEKDLSEMIELGVNSYIYCPNETEEIIKDGDVPELKLHLVDVLQSFIAHTHIDLVEAILEDIRGNKCRCRCEANNRLDNVIESLRAKYLNNI